MLRYFVATAVLSCFGSSFAGSVNGYMISSQIWSGSNPLSLQHSETVGAVRTSLRGNLVSGAIGAEAYGGSLSQVSWSENMRFTSGYGITMMLQYRFHGRVSPANGQPGYTDPSTNVEFGITIGSELFVIYLTNGICPSPSSPNLSFSCISQAAGVDFDRTGSLPIFVTNSPILISASLSARATRQNEWADAYRTGLFYFDVPPGVTYTTDSGVFLSTASPVPEIATWLSLLIGLTIVTAAANTRFRRI